MRLVVFITDSIDIDSFRFYREFCWIVLELGFMYEGLIFFEYIVFWCLKKNQGFIYKEEVEVVVGLVINNKEEYKKGLVQTLMRLEQQR